MQQQQHEGEDMKEIQERRCLETARDLSPGDLVILSSGKGFELSVRVLLLSPPGRGQDRSLHIQKELLLVLLLLLLLLGIHVTSAAAAAAMVLQFSLLAAVIASTAAQGPAGRQGMPTEEGAGL